MAAALVVALLKPVATLVVALPQLVAHLQQAALVVAPPKLAVHPSKTT